MSPFGLAATTSQIAIGLLIFFASIIVIGTAFIVVASKFYIKVGPDEAIVKTGMGGMNVIIDGGALVWPVIHRYEKMDLTLKSFEIAREGSEGLICKDNIRADIKCAFFNRVDKTTEEIKEVAQSIGCKRASVVETLRELFDAKFSEALKTVGKQFEFVELYDKRDKFKNEILKVIGTDLNGYRLDDCAIDYLEQTRLELNSNDNVSKPLNARNAKSQRFKLARTPRPQKCSKKIGWLPNELRLQQTKKSALRLRTNTALS